MGLDHWQKMQKQLVSQPGQPSQNMYGSNHLQRITKGEDLILSYSCVL